MKKMMIVIVGCLVAVSMTGCAMLMGVKEYNKASDGTVNVKFVTGGDVHFGLNGIDTVEDNRSIKPGNSNYIKPSVTSTELRRY